MDCTCSEWRNGIIKIVSAFANMDFQRAAWSGKIDTSFNSPDEMMCALFDDMEFNDFLKDCSSELSEQCVGAGQRLLQALKNYDWPMQANSIDSDMLLVQDSWRQICMIAANFLVELKRVQ